jgi:nitrogen fixation protein FixH
MKWNWGTKLVLAMAAFMTLVIIFVVLMMQESVDLVEKDYYPKGQAHQQLIDKRNNASGFADSILVSLSQGDVMISFPQQANPKGIKGTVHFYQRISGDNDQFADLSLDSAGVFRYPANMLQGRYILKIDWTNGDQSYYTEKTIDLP